MSKLEAHFEYSDDEFESEFEALTLPEPVFSHEAHLRLAWIHLKKYGLKSAMISVPEQLKKFGKLHGAKNYHETLTIAAVHIVNGYMESDHSEFKDFIAKNQWIKNGFRDLVQAHYSKGLLDSKEAKKVYVAPDLMSFS